jgi:hypothetical protein
MNVHFVFETKAGRVTDYRLPGAIFHGRAAYDEFAPDRQLYEAAVASYANEIQPAAIKLAVEFQRSLGFSTTPRAVRGDAKESLRIDLLALGYGEEADIQWHIANPGKRQSMLYA